MFIIGRSNGIGLALAHDAALEGAKVSILVWNIEKLNKTKQTIKLSTDHDVVVFSADVRDFDSLKKAIEEAGLIDVLVCNQGVFVSCELEGQELEEVKFMLDANLIGTFHLIKASLPEMKNQTDSYTFTGSFHFHIATITNQQQWKRKKSGPKVLSFLFEAQYSHFSFFSSRLVPFTALRPLLSLPKALRPL